MVGFFEKFKEEYSSLRLIPSKGQVSIEADRVPERAVGLPPITEEEVKVQKDEWHTDLDVQYLRQLYREHGWPDAFRREECLEKVDRLMEELYCLSRSDWEKDDYDPNISARGSHPGSSSDDDS